VHQLLVGLIIIERNDGDAIVQLVPERIDSVIHDNQVVKVTVRDDAQVFHVDALFGADAMVTVKSVLD